MPTLRSFRIALAASTVFLFCVSAGRALEVADDDTTEAKYEVWVSYVWDYTDFKKLNKERVEGVANGFYDEFRNKADWSGSGSRIVGNAAATIDHWKHLQTGGENENIDQADIALFVGHGAKVKEAGQTISDYVWALYDTTLFSEQANTKPNETGGMGVWGSEDLEWIIALACHSTRDRDWYMVFGGLHLLVGYKRDIFGHEIGDGEKFGRGLANLMLREEKPLSVWQAWWAINETWAKGTRPFALSRIDHAIMGEHVWGRGSVHREDPPAFHWNDSVEYFDWSTKEISETPPQRGRVDDAMTVYPTATGTIHVPDVATLGEDWPPTLPRFCVVPRVVDDAYVQSIAGKFCSELGVFCAPDAEFGDDLGNRWLTEGPHCLIVSEASGGFAYLDTGAWLVPPEESPAGVPGPYLASVIAGRFLQNTELRPEKSYLDLDRSFMGELTFGRAVDTVTTVVDSTWVTHIAMDYGRWLGESPGDLPVVQEGAFRVHIGEGEQITAFFHNGWRDLDAGAAHDSIISLDQAVTRLIDEETLGSWCGCDTMVVSGVELGYFESGPQTVQQCLEPVYIFATECTDSSSGQVLVSALDVPATAAPGTSPRRDELRLATHPNPIRREVTVHYEIPESGPVKLAVYGVDGRVITYLEDGERARGAHAVRWDGRDRNGRPVASGTYFLRMDYAGDVKTRKLVMLR